MKRMIKLFLGCFCALILGAQATEANLHLDGTFVAATTANGLPSSWMFHTWEGYLPSPKTCIETSPSWPFRVLHVGKAPARYGVGIMASKKYQVVCGDHLTIQLWAKGSGKAWVTIVRWTNQNSGWNQTETRYEIPLTSSWQLHECSFTIHDGPNGKTGSCQVELGMDKDAEGYFADIQGAFEPGLTCEREILAAKLDKDLRRVCEVIKVCGEDDFEDASRSRDSQVKLCRDIIAPGLLSETTLGKYEVSLKHVIPLEGMITKLDEDTFYTASMRLYKAFDVGTVALCSAGGSVMWKTQAGIPYMQGMVQFGDSTQDVAQLMVPITALPADIAFGVSPIGKWYVKVTSLSDSSVRVRSGSVETFKQPNSEGWKGEIRLQGTGSVVLDKIGTQLTQWKVKDFTPPIQPERLRTFDPVKAGWSLVFADEFEGTKLDWNKWFVPWYMSTNTARYISLDGKGLLALNVDKNPQTGKLETGSIWTKDAWQYGYFEARLRFTRKPGWWSAFWLYGVSNRNPLWDGFEIDIQEDYYTRPEKKGGEERKTLDHNLHVYTGKTLKSWNWNSTLPGSLDDFYVLGCKWTPFEISYYLNGKLIESKSSHSPYDSVTFDATHHAFATAPLHAIISGQIMNKNWFASDISDTTFPESYLVDYVRVYQPPKHEADLPQVKWAIAQSQLEELKSSGADIGGYSPSIGAQGLASDLHLFASEGTLLHFTGTVTALHQIKAVYLFDNGYLMDFKKEAPYSFEIPFTTAAYARTRWMAAGRSGVQVPFDAYPHVFVMVAEDEKGNVGYSKRLFKVLRPKQDFVPYQQQMPLIPGEIGIHQFDEGGQGVAYYDTTPGNKYWGKKVRPQEDVDVGENLLEYSDTGEWLNYTCQIAKTQKYCITLRCVPIRIPDVRNLPLFLDGKPLGEFSVLWGMGESGTITGNQMQVVLPAGRHTLTLLIHAPIDVKVFSIKPL